MRKVVLSLSLGIAALFSMSISNADKQFTVSLGRSPSVAAAQQNFDQGTLAAMFNDYKTSINRFQSAISVDPSHAPSYYGLAASFAKIGKKTQAMGALRRAISLDGGYRERARIDMDFAGTWGDVEFIALIRGV